MSQTNRSIVLTFVCLLGVLGLVCAAVDQLSKDHLVPGEKKLPGSWVKALYEPGAERVYRGEELKPIGMPVGGIAAGQMYLGGDGRLLHWAVFNKHVNTGYGSRCYRLWEPEARVGQGFAVRVARAGKAVVRRLDGTGVRDVRFVGEYPIGRVEYVDPALGLDVTMRAFSPFIPLDANDSSLPATVLHFTLKNTGAEPANVTLAGWLDNAVLFHHGQSVRAEWVNQVRRGKALGWVDLSARKPPAPATKAKRPAIVFADFEGTDYGDWKATGKAFGKGPARGTLPEQQAVSGFRGKRLVNTYLGKDTPQGTLTSPEFTIDRPYVNFLIGGGNHAGSTCMNLLVGGKVVRTATGKNLELLVPRAWSVQEFVGKKARLQIVDRASGAWGHVNIDQIQFADTPDVGTGDLKDLEDFGTMGLGVLAGGQSALLSERLGAGELPGALFDADGSLATGPRAARVPAAAGRAVTLAPNQTAEVVFVVAWHFPNHKRGRWYAERFRNAAAVAEYVAANYQRLEADTRLWHDTYYDSTLPRWLLDRLHMPVSILATNTVQWWGNGRFWAYEGVGCCEGTCTHVWNYEHALARLFPSLERSIRIMQDFDAGFDERTGLVGFRSNRAYAADGQCGTVLKAYREHLISADGAFLKAHYKRIRLAMEFLLAKDASDGDEDGLITNSQHNTFDINFHGANTFVGSLYLAALRAAEEMAKLSADEPFATRCRKAFASGRKLTMERLFDGEYFFQSVDLAKHAEHQYGRGCLADQLFGQNWAHQLGLGYIYPPEAVAKAIRAVYKYNWTPDVGPHNRAHRAERIFARPGEGGLFICTWPKSKHLERSGVRYRNEVWTGIEYQVAAGLLYEDCLDEGLAVIRAVHDRYDAKKRNPWNEVECGDHYARAMSCWGCLLALSGFEYDGPAGQIAFAPRITPDDFRCPFTAAEGWGTLTQKRAGGSQTNTIAVRWGTLRLTEVGVALPAGLAGAKVRAAVGRKALEAAVTIDAGRARVKLARPVVLKAGQTLSLTAAR